MTNDQFFILAGCILLAPHLPKQFSFISGGAMLVMAGAINYGL